MRRRFVAQLLCSISKQGLYRFKNCLGVMFEPSLEIRAKSASNIAVSRLPPPIQFEVKRNAARVPDLARLIRRDNKYSFDSALIAERIAASQLCFVIATFF